MRKHLKLIVSLVLVSAVAVAGTISVEVGGFQYLKGLVLTAPSGSNAIGVATNGARVDFGAGPSDYASSNGTTVTFAGLVTVSGETILSAVASAQGGLYVDQGLYARDFIENSLVGKPVTVADAEGLAIVGVATVNLATCNATAPPTGTRGTWQYDTTTNTMKYCNGTGWVEPRTGTAIDGGIIYGASLGYASTGQGTTGQVVVSGGAGAPTFGLQLYGSASAGQSLKWTSVPAGGCASDSDDGGRVSVPGAYEGDPCFVGRTGQQADTFLVCDMTGMAGSASAIVRLCNTSGAPITDEETVRVTVTHIP